MEYVYYKVESVVKKIVVNTDSQVRSVEIARREKGCSSIVTLALSSSMYVLPDESMIRQYTSKEDISDIQAAIEEKFPFYLLNEGVYLDTENMIAEIIAELEG